MTDLVENHMRDMPPGTPEDGAAPSSLPGPLAQFAPGDEPTEVLYGRWIRSAVDGDVTSLADVCRANRSPTP